MKMRSAFHFIVVVGCRMSSQETSKVMIFKPHHWRKTWFFNWKDFNTRASSLSISTHDVVERVWKKMSSSILNILKEDRERKLKMCVHCRERIKSYKFEEATIFTFGIQIWSRKTEVGVKYSIKIDFLSTYTYNMISSHLISASLSSLVFCYVITSLPFSSSSHPGQPPKTLSSSIIPMKQQKKKI